MPNLKKAAKDKVTYRRVVTLRPETAAQVEELARQDQRPVAAMLRILIERAIAIQPELAASAK